MQDSKVYAILLFCRVFFALQKSYLHPDEFFQGPEIVVGDILQLPHIRTWEFQENNVRSVVPIYIFYAPVVYLLRFIGMYTPAALFYGFRVQQLSWTLVIDYLIYKSGGRRKVLFWTSSYVTWVWFTHTFSNSHEALLVLLTVHISRSRKTTASAFLGIIVALGLFTRISFIAFVLPVALQLLLNARGSINKLTITAIAFTASAAAIIYIDSLYYGQNITITPWNNFLYNSDAKNLAVHGLHARYTHLLNLTVLLGPAMLCLAKTRYSMHLACAASGFIVLSTAQHQEARFLLPCMPLLFLSFDLSILDSRKLLIFWLLFNIILGLFLGTMHQSGVIPMALHISQLVNVSEVSWTKTYPAPQHLAGAQTMVEHIYGSVDVSKYGKHLVLPVLHGMNLTQYKLVWSYTWHFSLDDLGEYGMRIFTDRGIGLYERR